MAQPNAAIMAQLAGYNEWNIALTTLSSDNKALFDDELAANTTYQLRLVNIKDPSTVYVTGTYGNLRGAVSEAKGRMDGWEGVKFGTGFAQLKVLATVSAFQPDMAELGA